MAGRYISLNCRTNIKSLLSGQSLFEVILAIAVSAIILTGIVSLSSTSVNTSTVSKNKSQANRYTSQAMEFIRKEKAFTGWNAFRTTIGTDPWCLKKLEFSSDTAHACGSSEYLQDPVGINTIFIRQLTILSATINEINFEIRVGWIDDKGTHETRTVSTLTDW